jgi:hypothetical protein
MGDAEAQGVSPQLKKFLIPFLVVDAVFCAGVVFYVFHVRGGGSGWAGKADLRVELRHPEAKLTEIDLVNDGTAPGMVAVSVDVTWPDAEFVDAKGLSSFDEVETGRRSLRFEPEATLAGVKIEPGKPEAVGWVKLTDDVPVRAEIDTGGGASQP